MSQFFSKPILNFLHKNTEWGCGQIINQSPFPIICIDKKYDSFFVFFSSHKKVMNLVFILALLMFDFCQCKFYLVKTGEKNTRNHPNLDYDGNNECEKGQIWSPKDGECHEVFTKFRRASFGTKIKPR